MKYRIAYGDLNGDTREKVVNASSMEEARNKAMAEAAEDYCWWDAVPEDDEAKVEAFIELCEDTMRHTLRTLAGVGYSVPLNTSKASKFADALHAWMVEYARSLRETP